MTTIQVVLPDNMLVMFLAMLVAILAIPCVLAPEKIWKAFTDGDDGPDYTLHDVNLVSLRALISFLSFT